MKKAVNKLRAWHDAGHLVLDNGHHEVSKVKLWTHNEKKCNEKKLWAKIYVSKIGISAQWQKWTN